MLVITLLSDDLIATTQIREVDNGSSIIFKAKAHDTDDRDNQSPVRVGYSQCKLTENRWIHGAYIKENRQRIEWSLWGQGSSTTCQAWRYTDCTAIVY